jgi:predicted SAM-dependent methyltransferase
MKLHLGCGSNFVEGWINVDYSLGARVAHIPVVGTIAKVFGFFGLDWNPKIVLHNLTKPLPWPDTTVAVIYSSHTLEHLRSEDGDALIRECARVLKLGGILRIAVPDLERYVADYTKGRVSANFFIDSLLVFPQQGQPLRKRILNGYFDDGHTHKCMYDHTALITLMEKHGLKAEKRTSFDSRIDGIRDIELEDRTVNCVVVEGVKAG